MNFKFFDNSTHFHLQIALRTAYLEKENSTYRIRISTVENENSEARKDVEELRSKIKSYKIEQNID